MLNFKPTSSKNAISNEQTTQKLSNKTSGDFLATLLENVHKNDIKKANNSTNEKTQTQTTSPTNSNQTQTQNQTQNQTQSQNQAQNQTSPANPNQTQESTKDQSQDQNPQNPTKLKDLLNENQTQTKNNNNEISKNDGENNTQILNNSALATLINDDLSAVTAGALITNPLSDDSQSALESAKFMKILGLLDKLATGDDKLNKILNTEINVAQIKSIKSLEDLIKIADKFGLNLSKISITNSDIKALQSEFKNLNLKGFFDNVSLSLSKANEQKSKQNLNNPKYNLAKLLNGVNEAKNVLKTEPKELKFSKNSALNESLILALNEDKKVGNDLKALLNDTQIKTEPKSTPISLKNKSNDATIDSYLDAISKKAAQNASTPLQDPSTPSNFENFTNDAQSTQNEQSTIKSSEQSILKDIMLNAKLKNISKETQISSVRSFAAEMAQKINDYKPPITRIAMVLNPAELGEVSVTMISRANNLHINITSNAQTMQLFVANQAEFKNSLVNMGYSDVQMNFSDAKQGGGNGSQNRAKSAKRAYENDDIQINEINENGEKTLEVILPKYI